MYKDKRAGVPWFVIALILLIGVAFLFSGIAGKFLFGTRSSFSQLGPSDCIDTTRAIKNYYAEMDLRAILLNFAIVAEGNIELRNLCHAQM